MRERPLAVAEIFRDVLDKLSDHVAKTMNLRLPHDMVRNPAGVLDFFLPVQDLPDRLGFDAGRIPHVNGEDQRTPTGGVVEDHLGGCVRENSPVPIELTIAADTRKGL